MLFFPSKPERTEQQTRRRLDIIPSGVFPMVLDVGCGDGSLSLEVAKKVQATEIHGVEANSEKAKKAKERGLLVESVNLHYEKLPYQDAYFDLVFAGEIIEHVLDPDALLSEIRRVLRPGGILVLTTPNLAYCHSRITFLLFGIHPHGMEMSAEDARVGFGFLKRVKGRSPTGHLRVFTKIALEDLLLLHGFSVKSLKGCYTAMFPSPLFEVDKIISLFPSFASKLLVAAEKTNIQDK